MRRKLLVLLLLELASDALLMHFGARMRWRDIARRLVWRTFHPLQAWPRP